MNVRFGAQIAAAAAAHHLDPRLLAAVAAQETGGPGSSSGRNIVGDGGHGRGLFQIDDRSWAFARTLAAMDPAANADAAAGILADDLGRYGGNVRAALSAYNAGSPTATGTRTTWPDGERLGYADSVMRHFAALGGAPETLAGVPETLAADQRDTAAAVNELGALAGARPEAAPNTAAGAPAETLGIASFPFMPPPLVASGPPPPLTSTVAWSTLTSAGAKNGAEADSALADLVDSGDVFDPAAAADG